MIRTHAITNDVTSLTVACIGDSITRGWGSTDSYVDDYASVINRLVSDISGIRFINYGVGSATMLKAGIQYDAITA